MDRWKSDGFCQSIQADVRPSPTSRLQNSLLESSQRVEMEVKDSLTARKVQKADREKLRRDRLNEQFLELGNALDPDRPKNDKATILTDTVQMLKDLTAQVNRLKAEYTSLSEESRELTQEKNELREEKAALKSDIDNLYVQYQQRLRSMFPWTAMDPSVVMGPPTYPFPMPVPVPPGHIPMHPSLQPFPFFSSPNLGALANPCSTFLPYPSPLGNPQMEQPSTHYISPHPQPSSRSQTASKQDSRSKSSDRQRGSNAEKSVDSNDVATELELKTPGSSPTGQFKSVPDHELSSEGRKGKQWSSARKTSGITDEGCASRCSSSRAPQESLSNSVGDGSVANN